MSNEEILPIPDDDFEAPPMPLERVGRNRTRPAQKEMARDNVRDSDTRLVRSRKRTSDGLYVDPRLIPPGMSYEWKCKSCYGQENAVHIANLSDNHWHPVPPDRHQGMVVEKDGLVLMERPAYLTNEARQEDYDEAVGQVRKVHNTLSDSKDGQFTRDHPSVRRVTKLNASFDTSMIPED